MDRNNKAALRRIMKMRDKAYEALQFNRDYLQVAAGLIDQKDQAALRLHELKYRKRLLPLELAALSPKDRNEALLEREIEAMRQAQDKPQKAIELAFQRDLKKHGEKAAMERKAYALARLADELAEKTKNARKMYPASTNESVSEEAVSAYRDAASHEHTIHERIRKQQSAKKQARLDILKDKLDKQDKVHQEVFDKANKRLNELNSGNQEMLQQQHILSVRSLKMYFSGVKAVDDLTFNIKKGEIFGLIGPNGAGKTTVFNCVTQFYKPTEGSIRYIDRFGNLINLNDLRTANVVKTGISRTFQNLELVYWLSVMDNLLIGAHALYRSSLADQFLHTAKLRREEEVFRQRAAKLLDRLGILAYKDMFPFGLPYGVLKKVELARTLMSDPQLIILDEPAAGLNEAETEQLEEIIRLIRDDFNCTIFLVEHDMNLVMNVCDTVCAMSFGKLLAVGTPKEIQDNQAVQEAYLGTD